MKAKWLKWVLVAACLTVAVTYLMTGCEARRDRLSARPTAEEETTVPSNGGDLPSGQTQNIGGASVGRQGARAHGQITSREGNDRHELSKKLNVFGLAYGDGDDHPIVNVARPALDEEVWVIAKPAPVGDDAQPADDRTPGSGAMITRLPDSEKDVPVPLKHTDVRASITGYIAAVDVAQHFHNPFSSKIEAVYVFPLPENAAVNEFVMTVGDRKIRGIIRERGEAEKVYNEAKAQGYTASLMTQERPNVFTQKVANIEPGKEIDVNIRYYHTLAYQDGWYEWVFPMVVGPRYNPGGSTEGIGAVGRGNAGISGQKTEVQYLKPGERSGHDISLAVDLDAGVVVDELKSANHNISAALGGGEAKTTRAGQSIMTPAGSYLVDPNQMHYAVKLADGDKIPNKDFVLRYRVADDKVKSALFTHRDDRGGYFTLMLLPPRELEGLAREPVEMVFLLDVSGSMSGEPWDRVRQGVTTALRNMDSRDSFQIVTFAGSASAMTPSPLIASAENAERGIAYVKSMHEGGGTEMLKGFELAIKRDEDSKRRRLVALMTDGYIGNEAGIVSLVEKSRDNIRYFSFGVGSSPNRYLMDGVAKAGSGAVAYVGLRDDASEVMKQYLERVSHPAMTDIQIDWGGIKVSEVYPKRLPDLYVGRPVILTGRFEGKMPGAIRVSGKAGEKVIAFDVAPRKGDTSPKSALAGTQALPSVWGRARIADLADRIAYGHDRGDELMNEIKRFAIEYSLMSDFTAFVAVDSAHKTEDDHGTTVNVPVPVPEGVRYETTVEER